MPKPPSSPNPKPPTPDLRHDVDALFNHLVENLGRDLSQPMDWSFSIESPNLDLLGRIADDQGDDFEVELIEDVTVVDDNGRRRKGDPIMAFIVQGVLGPDEVKQLYARFKQIALDNRVKYTGVSCAEPFDADAMFGWLELEDAVWRLRSFEDTGLEAGAEVGFVFGVAARDIKHANAIEKAFRAAGFETLEVDDDEDAEGDGPLVLIHVAGKNDDDVLTKAYAKVEKAAAGASAELLGVQFEDPEGEEGDDDDEDDGDDGDEGDSDDND